MRVRTALARSPIVAILGPRQCGKTTLARALVPDRHAATYDLESPQDLARLQNPEMVLASEPGLVIIDEIQRQPGLFNILRVLVDRRPGSGRFLILGSASPAIVRGVSESLAGRVEFIDLTGFDLGETGALSADALWLRGGFPRSFLAGNDADSFAWREGFVRTFLERDIPQLGIGVPAPTMRRFWTMLAHMHASIWNAADPAGSMGLSPRTVRSYLDILTGTYMVRQLQPWFANIGKRQVKSPRVYLRDSGLLHLLLGLSRKEELLGHARAGASWEGFAMEQALALTGDVPAYFWATHQRAELDLLLDHHGRRIGVEFKFTETPSVTKSMRIALADLALDHLWVVHAGKHAFEMAPRVTAIPIADVGRIAADVNPPR